MVYFRLQPIHAGAPVYFPECGRHSIDLKTFADNKGEHTIRTCNNPIVKFFPEDGSAQRIGLNRQHYPDSLTADLMARTVECQCLVVESLGELAESTGRWTENKTKNKRQKTKSF
jgi:hypothetical protein